MNLLKLPLENLQTLHPAHPQVLLLINQKILLQAHLQTNPETHLLMNLLPHQPEHLKELHLILQKELLLAHLQAILLVNQKELLPVNLQVLLPAHQETNLPVLLQTHQLKNLLPLTPPRMMKTNQYSFNGDISPNTQITFNQTRLT